LTESPFNRTPFNRKFILPNGDVTDFQKIVISPKKNCAESRLTENSSDRKLFCEERFTEDSLPDYSSLQKKSWKWNTGTFYAGGFFVRLNLRRCRTIRAKNAPVKDFPPSQKIISGKNHPTKNYASEELSGEELSCKELS
jgi:hypothetical protein